jgi:TetR/AcrR family transcriptional regulator, fatty acid metabolism regulator protein
MPYRKTPKMIARRDSRRLGFVESATRLFGRHGYHATTVPMIVQDAGSSTGSFYSFFRNKEDVFAAALEALGVRAAEVIERAKASEPDPVQQVRVAVESLFTFLAANPREARILIVESSGLGVELEQVRRRVLAHHADSASTTIEANRGRFAPVDAAIAARCMVGAVMESLYHWLEMPEEKRPDAAAAAREVAEYNVRALRA